MAGSGDENRHGKHGDTASSGNLTTPGRPYSHKRRRYKRCSRSMSSERSGDIESPTSATESSSKPTAPKVRYFWPPDHVLTLINWMQTRGDLFEDKTKNATICKNEVFADVDEITPKRIGEKWYRLRDRYQKAVSHGTYASGCEYYAELNKTWRLDPQLALENQPSDKQLSSSGEIWKQEHRQILGDKDIWTLEPVDSSRTIFADEGYLEPVDSSRTIFADEGYQESSHFSPSPWARESTNADCPANPAFLTYDSHFNCMFSNSGDGDLPDSKIQKPALRVQPPQTFREYKEGLTNRNPFLTYVPQTPKIFDLPTDTLSTPECHWESSISDQSLPGQSSHKVISKVETMIPTKNVVSEHFECPLLFSRHFKMTVDEGSSTKPVALELAEDPLLEAERILKHFKRSSTGQSPPEDSSDEIGTLDNPENAGIMDSSGRTGPEILDERCGSNFCARAVPEGSDVIKLYEKHSSKLRDVFSNLEFPLYSFTMMLRGNEQDGSEKVVLFVWIPPASRYDEESCQYSAPMTSEDELKSALEKICSPLDCEVELLHGTPGTFASKSFWDCQKNPKSHFFIDQLFPGAGIKGKHYFGTIGGLLVDTKTQKKYAVTCGHVLDSSDDIYSMDTTSVDILYERIECLKRKWIEELSEVVDKIKRLDCKELVPRLFALNSAKRFFEWQENEKSCIDKAADEKQKLGMLKVGKVASVKLPTLGKNTLAQETRYLKLDGSWKAKDWGLVEAVGVDTGCNSALWPEWLGPIAREYSLCESSNSRREGSSVGGTEVMKLGRSSGFTFGTLSAIPMTTGEGSQITTDRMIVSKPNSPFALPGDSGSLVFDKDGSVIGMLHRGLYPDPSNKKEQQEFLKGGCPVYIQSYNDIKKWIKQKLNMDVKLDTTYGGPLSPWWLPSRKLYDQRNVEESVADL